MIVSIRTLLAASLAATFAVQASATEVKYAPYIQPGDASAFEQTDRMVVAWQTDGAIPNASAYLVEYGTDDGYGKTINPVGRTVDNYLAADSSLPVPPTATGPRIDYYALLAGLKYDTTYHYRVIGPGLPANGFKGTFHTRKRGDSFSFQVMGDEGSFPAVPGTNPARLANYEARIVNTMYSVDRLHIPGVPQLDRPDLALNTGDNVYNRGSERVYEDWWMPVWNSDVASNETGAPYIRHIPNYIVVGNHDVGGSGDFVNLLGDDVAGEYSGNLDGGDALAHFNNYYFPLNGPTGTDSQYVFNGDSVTRNGFFFSYKGVNYSSPAAIEAFRKSTEVDTGRGTKRQIDHMANYSFDYGNAHFLFLDANPHLFNALLPGGALYQSPPVAFPDYPSVLRQWVVQDLDSSRATWKIVVFHQPAFSSGNATLRNSQMRRVAAVLERHGANMVFNGHEHNYQRSLPLRALAPVADVPSLAAGPAVAVDTSFDGDAHAVPDGVLYLVEGAGGNRDFDGGFVAPRGSGGGLDQEDSATGLFSFAPGATFEQGPASWLDTYLSNNQMGSFLPGAGSGTKITARFKAKLFSFGHVTVEGNRLTLYQISEPLQSTSSATPANPAPFGTDANGKPVNDPIPDTLIDPATGLVVSKPAVGTSVLLDKFSVVKPDVGNGVRARIAAPSRIAAGAAFDYTATVENASKFALNGAQVVLTLPAGVEFAGTPNDDTTVTGGNVVVSLGRLDKGELRSIKIACRKVSGTERALPKAVLRSSTALPVNFGG